MCLAVPGEVLSIEGDDPVTRTGKVRFGGIVKEVNLAYVPEAQVGDYVLVHVGFALSVIDVEEARKIFSYLDEMEETSSGSASETGAFADPSPDSSSPNAAL